MRRREVDVHSWGQCWMLSIVGVACSRGSSVVHWSPGCVELLSGGLGKVMSGGELVMVVARMIGRSESSRDGWFKVCQGEVLGEG